MLDIDDLQDTQYMVLLILCYTPQSCILQVVMICLVIHILVEHLYRMTPLLTNKIHLRILWMRILCNISLLRNRHKWHCLRASKIQRGSRFRQLILWDSTFQHYRVYKSYLLRDCIPLRHILRAQNQLWHTYILRGIVYRKWHQLLNTDLQHMPLVRLLYWHNNSQQGIWYTQHLLIQHNHLRHSLLMISLGLYTLFLRGMVNMLLGWH